MDLPGLEHSRLDTDFNNISNILPKKPINTENNILSKGKPKTEAKLWEDKREKVIISTLILLILTLAIE